MQRQQQQPSRKRRAREVEEVEVEDDESEEEEEEEEEQNAGTQSAGERKGLRLRYLQLISNVTSNRASLCEPDGAAAVSSALGQAHELFSSVSNTREAALDSQLISHVTALGAEQIARLRTADRGYSAVEFVDKLLAHLSSLAPAPARSPVPPGEDAAEEDVGRAPVTTVAQWAELGRAARRIWRTTPAMDVMLGPFSVAADAVEAAKKKGRAPAKRAATENNAQMAKPDELNKITDGQGESAETAKRVAEMRKRIGSAAGGGRVELWRLVLDPESFGQTVENLFYLSFLVKDGHVSLTKEKDGSVTVGRAQQPTEEQLGEDGVHNKQCILHVDPEIWGCLRAKYPGQPGFLPHRAPVAPSLVSAPAPAAPAPSPSQSSRDGEDDATDDGQ